MKKWFKNSWAGEIPIQYANVHITSAEILALYTTPKVLVAAPGAGKAIEFLSAVARLDYNSATYATYGILTVKLSGGTAVSDACAAAALVQQVDDCIEFIPPVAAETELVANQGLSLFCDTGNPVTGDSPIDIHVAYRVHDFN